jgi:hypothetical protein
MLISGSKWGMTNIQSLEEAVFVLEITCMFIKYMGLPLNSEQPMLVIAKLQSQQK